MERKKRNRRYKQDKLVTVLQGLVTPHLEYASSIWQVRNCEQLEIIQRKSLALCLGVLGTAGVEAALRIRDEYITIGITKRSICNTTNN